LTSGLLLVNAILLIAAAIGPNHDTWARRKYLAPIVFRGQTYPTFLINVVQLNARDGRLPVHSSGLLSPNASDKKF
jgi:hypothetical protein